MCASTLSRSLVRDITDDPAAVCGDAPRRQPGPARRRWAATLRGGGADGHDAEGGGDADDERDGEVAHVHAVVGREVRYHQAGRVQPAPVAEADEDHVADRRGPE